jgi:hypothetical protein
MAKRTRIKSISISFGEGLRDDVQVDVEGSITKAQLRYAVLEAVHNKLRRMSGIKDISFYT